MSRNADRVQTQTQKVQEIPQQPLTYSPPTTLVALPSSGKFYPEGHPLHGSDTVEVKQMTTREEEILINQTLIQKGIVTDRLIKSVLLNQAIDVDSLLVGDKNAILIALRVDAYGSGYEVEVPCPTCGQKNQKEIDLSELKHKEISEEFEPTDGGTFFIELPKTNAKVECRLMTGEDEKAIAEANKKAKKYNIENPLVTQYAQMITSVNGNQDPTFISSFIVNMPAMDSRTLRNTYKKAVPDVDMTFEFKCDLCSHEQGMEVPITANFFWSD